jgi:hypothetical protein
MSDELKYFVDLVKETISPEEWGKILRVAEAKLERISAYVEKNPDAPALYPEMTLEWFVSNYGGENEQTD